MKPYFRLACSEDLQVIAENIDEQGRFECEALLRQDPLDSLLYCLKEAIEGRALVYVVCNARGTPVAAFGLINLGTADGLGSIWFLTTKDWTPSVAAATLRQSPEVIRRMMQTLHVRVAYNWVPAMYKQTIKWCEAVGFIVHPIKVHEGVPCRFVEWRTN